MDQCRQRCWIVAAVVAVAVLLAVWVFGDGSLVKGLLFALLAGGLLAGLLIWGVCEGRGTAAENESLMATYWEPEAFTPSRRVVAAGGRVVSQQPLGNGTDDLGSALPLESVTLQASRDPAVARLVTPPAAAEPQSAEAEAELPLPPSETVALLATPSIASVIPVEPLTQPAVQPPREAAPITGTAAPGDADPSRGIATGPDRVATITDELGDEAGEGDDAYVPVPTDPGDHTDELTRIKGVGPIQAQWLRDSGVTRLADIAAWDEADIARFAGMMGRNGYRIRKQDWVSQAKAMIGDDI